MKTIEVQSIYYLWLEDVVPSEVQRFPDSMRPLCSVLLGATSATPPRGLVARFHRFENLYKNKKSSQIKSTRQLESINGKVTPENVLYIPAVNFSSFKLMHVRCNSVGNAVLGISFLWPVSDAIFRGCHSRLVSVAWRRQHQEVESNGLNLAPMVRNLHYSSCTEILTYCWKWEEKWNENPP